MTAISLLALPLLGFALQREARRLAETRFARIQESFGTTMGVLR